MNESNPYIQQAQGLDQQGLNPVFQNIASQQANQNAMLAQQNQLVNQASGVGGSGSGMNPMAMAMALRGKNPNDPMNMLNNASSSQDYMNKIGATSSGVPMGGSAGDYANEWWMK
jgi:hypothetical protein